MFHLKNGGRMGDSRRRRPHFDLFTVVWAATGGVAGAIVGYAFGGWVGAIAVGIFGTVAGFLYGVFGRSVPKQSPKKDTRYLGNSNTKEIHDLSNLSSACRIGKMREEHKVFFDNIKDVEQAIKTEGYNGCRWCLSKYHTD